MCRSAWGVGGGVYSHSSCGVWETYIMKERKVMEMCVCIQSMCMCVVHIYCTYVHDYKRHMYIYFSQSVMGGTVCGLLKDHANY